MTPSSLAPTPLAELPSSQPTFSRSVEQVNEMPENTRQTPAERRSARARHNAWRLKEVQRHHEERLREQDMLAEADDERRDVAIHDPRMFNPFRYLASRRKRTMSIISHEAQDGTAANTVVGSPTTSMLSTAPFALPDERDPVRAAEEWRNQEEAKMQKARRERKRRPRPGVVFAVKEDPHEESKPRPRKISATRDERSSSQHTGASKQASSAPR